jgi:beta propeller repeat protein
MTDDLPDPDPKVPFWYFQIVAYDLATPAVAPVRVTYDPTVPFEGWVPAVDGNLVVWEDYRNDPERAVLSAASQNSDIFIADLTDPLGSNNTVPNYALCTASGSQLNPRISGHWVVWEDWRSGTPNIYAYDLSLDSDGNGTPNWKEEAGVRPNPDPAEIQLTDDNWAHYYPDISGNTVVWLDLRRDDGTGSTVDIYAMDLTTRVETAVVTDPPTRRGWLRIDGRQVVWADLRSGPSAVFWGDLDTGVAVPIGAGNAWDGIPDISGNRVAYSRYRIGDVYNVVTQEMLTKASVGVRTFTDVANDNWAWAWIEAAAAHQVVAGYPDGSYQPTFTVTRDQMAAYIARALAGGDAQVPAPPSSATFTDVPVGSWAFQYIEYCFAEGMVQGFEDGSYQPGLAVDRGTMAVYIARAVAGGDAQVPEPSGSATFSDVTASYWSYRYIEYCADPARAIVQGYSDHTYRPGDQVTRDQMAVYIGRAFHLGS